jgi:hypothetical protein
MKKPTLVVSNVSNPPDQLGPFKITEGAKTPGRMAVLLWGGFSCGKTTFAATAPGDKLWISFGDNEHTSVQHRPDVKVMKLFDRPAAEVFKHGQSENPFGLDAYLAQYRNIETVVVDSATAISALALTHVIAKGVGAGNRFYPTIETPGLSAYGGRNGVTIEVLKGLLQVTAKHNVHIIITAHEDDPTIIKQDGIEVISHISIMLGGKLVNSFSWRLSEIWWMHQDRNGNRHLAIRPTKMRKPMKTRMFSGKFNPEFTLEYDADKPDDAKGQMTIARWFDEWEDNNWVKIVPPQDKVKDK